MGEIGRLTFIRRLVWHSKTAGNIAIPISEAFDDLATLCVNLVNFGPVTREFEIGKYVHLVIFSLKYTFQTNYLGIQGPIFTKFPP